MWTNLGTVGSGTTKCLCCIFGVECEVSKIVLPNANRSNQAALFMFEVAVLENTDRYDNVFKQSRRIMF